MDKISIIVPVFNIVNYIDQCVFSLTNQTYERTEIIIVDDGSTDGTLQKCQEIYEKYKNIKLISQRHGGVTSARKRGLQESTGEYVIFVDGDDWVESVMCQELLDLISKTKADFVSTGFFREQNDIIIERRKLSDDIYLKGQKEDWIKGMLLEKSTDKDMWISLCGKIFKREFIEECISDVPQNITYGEDLLNVLICVCKAQRFITNSKLYYHYVKRLGSCTMSKDMMILYKKYELLTEVCKQLKRFDIVFVPEFFNMVIQEWFVGSIDQMIFNDEYQIHRFFFERVEDLYDKNIIIYGAGRVGCDFYSQIVKYEKCHIDHWVDKNANSMKSPYRTIENIDVLRKNDYDAIVLAVKTEKMALSIRKELLDIGIEDKKIIWRKPLELVQHNYECMREQNSQSVLENCK